MTVQVTEGGSVPEAPKGLANEGRGYTVDEAADRLRSIFARSEQPPAAPAAELPQRAPEQTGDDRRDPSTGRWKATQQDSGEPDAAPPDGEPSGDEDQAKADPEPQAPTIEPPRSWDAKQRERFAKLSPEDKQIVLEHETRRDTELRRVQNETAERTKEAQAERTAAQAERQALSAELGELQKHLKTDLDRVQAEIDQYAKVDWDAAYDQDPIKASKAKHYRDGLIERKRDMIEATRAAELKRQELGAKSHAENETARREALGREKNRLVEAIPEWKDQAKLQAGLGEIGEYLEGVGISRERIAQITDADSILIAQKAMRWDKLQSGKSDIKARVESAPKMAKPAATQDRSSQKSDDLAKALANNKKHGTVDTLAAVFRAKGFGDDSRRR